MSIIEKAIEKLNAEQAGKTDNLPSDPPDANTGSAQAQAATRTVLDQSERDTEARNGKFVELPIDYLKSLGMVTPDEPR
uniref:hypothetical protein n=1 Tax=Sedimenticola sp. TaxID=1940285 RepID=UPI003D1168E2